MSETAELLVIYDILPVVNNGEDVTTQNTPISDKVDRIETIVETLENGDVSLEEAEELHEGGQTLLETLQDDLDAVDALTEHAPADLSLAQFSLRWILDHEAVSTVIPGSTTPEHIRANAAVSDVDPLGVDAHEAVETVYEKYVREHVHHRW